MALVTSFKPNLIDASSKPFNNLNDEDFSNNKDLVQAKPNFLDSLRNLFLTHVLRKIVTIMSIPKTLAMAALFNFLQLVAGFLAFIMDNNYIPYLLPRLWSIITSAIR